MRWADYFTSWDTSSIWQNMAWVWSASPPAETDGPSNHASLGEMLCRFTTSPRNWKEAVCYKSNGLIWKRKRQALCSKQSCQCSVEHLPINKHSLELSRRWWPEFTGKNCPAPSDPFPGGRSLLEHSWCLSDQVWITAAETFLTAFFQRSLSDAAINYEFESTASYLPPFAASVVKSKF